MPDKGRCAAININQRQLHLTLLPDKLGVCRFESGAALPNWLRESDSFFSVTGTVDETSLVCRDELIPANCLSERGFRLFKVEGPLDFSLTGILSSLLNPLAAAGIAVFTISTYDTDYLMIKEDKLEMAISALGAVANITI